MYVCIYVCIIHTHTHTHSFSPSLTLGRARAPRSHFASTPCPRSPLGDSLACGGGSAPTHTHTHTHTHTQTHTQATNTHITIRAHTHIHTYIHICICRSSNYTYIYIYVYIYIYIHTHIYIYYVYICIYIHIYYTHTGTYIHTYIHICIHMYVYVHIASGGGLRTSGSDRLSGGRPGKSGASRRTMSVTSWPAMIRTREWLAPPSGRICGTVGSMPCRTKSSRVTQRGWFSSKEPLVAIDRAAVGYSALISSARRSTSRQCSAIISAYSRSSRSHVSSRAGT